MAKKTPKTEVTETTAAPAVRRSRATKPAAATKSPATRRTSTARTKKAAVVADDRGLPAAVTAEVLAAVGPEPSHDDIATRAYYIHLRRNGAPGNPDYDWLLAIEELRRERGLI